MAPRFIPKTRAPAGIRHPKVAIAQSAVDLNDFALIPPSYHGGDVGPYFDANGNAWIFAFDTNNHMVALKSPGADNSAWQTFVSPAAVTSLSLDTVYDGANTVYALVQDASHVLHVYPFDLTTGSWNTEIFSSGTAPTVLADSAGDFPAGISLRSDGSFVIGYQGPLHSSTFRSVYYNTLSAAGVWGTAVHLDAGNATIHYSYKSQTIDGTDRVYFLWAHSNSSPQVRSLSSANALDTVANAATSTYSEGVHYTIFYDSTFNSLIVGISSLTTANTTTRSPAQANTVWTADTNTVGTALFGAPRVAPSFAYGSDGQIYVFYRDNATGNLFYNATASTTWTTANAAAAPGASSTGVAFVSAKAVPTGIAFVYFDTTFKYGLISLAPATTTYSKTGGGVSAGLAGMTELISVGKTGGGLSNGISGGTQINQQAKTGGGVSAGLTGATKILLISYSKTGGGISPGLTGATHSQRYVKTGGGLSAGLAGASNKIIYFVKAGGGLSPGVAGVATGLAKKLFVKTGGGLSAGLAGASKAFYYVKTGGGLSPGIAGTAKAVTTAKTGGGISPGLTGATKVKLDIHTGGGKTAGVVGTAKTITTAKTGGGITPGVIGATRVVSLGKTGGGVSAGLTGATKVVVFYSPKTGGGVSPGITGTAKSITTSKTAGAIVPGTPGGTYRALKPHTGGGISNGVTGGTRAQAYPKTGGVIGSGKSGGTWIQIFVKVGGGISAATTGAVRYVTFAKSAGGISSAVSGGTYIKYYVGKTGGGISPLVEGTAKKVTSPKTGGAVSAGFAGTVKFVTAGKTGGGKSPAVAGDTSEFLIYYFPKTGGSTSPAVSGTAKNVTFGKTGGGISPLSPGGTYAKRWIKTGGGISSSVAGGTQQNLWSKTGGGVSAGFAGGTYVKNIGYSKTGGGISSGVAGGTHTNLYVKTGGGIVPGVAGTAKKVTTSKTGGGIIPSVAGGTQKNFVIKIGGGITVGITGGTYRMLNIHTGGGVSQPFHTTVTNLLPNSGAESGITGWGSAGTGVVTMTRDNAISHSGLWAIKLVTDGSATLQGVNAGANGVFAQGVSVGQTYTASIYVYSASGGEVLTHQFCERDNTGTLLTTSSVQFTLVAGWNRLKITRTLTSPTVSQASMKVLTTNLEAITIWLDDAQIESGSNANRYVDTTAGAPATSNPSGPGGTQRNLWPKTSGGISAGITGGTRSTLNVKTGGGIVIGVGGGTNRRLFVKTAGGVSPLLAGTAKSITTSKTGGGLEGLQLITNLVKNGGFEVNASFIGYNQLNSPARVSTRSVFGTWSLQATASGGTSAGIYQTDSATPFNRMPSVDSQTYSGMCWVWTDQAGLSARISFEWYDASGVRINPTASGPITPLTQNGFTLVKYEGAVAPAGTVYMTPTVYTTTAPTSGTIFGYDGFQIEVGPSVHTYIDVNSGAPVSQWQRVGGPGAAKKVTFQKAAGGIVSSTAGGTRASTARKSGGGISAGYASATKYTTVQKAAGGISAGASGALPALRLVIKTGGAVTFTFSGGTYKQLRIKTGGGVSPSIGGGNITQAFGFAVVGGASSSLFAGASGNARIKKSGGGISPILAGGQEVKQLILYRPDFEYQSTLVSAEIFEVPVLLSAGEV